MVEGEIQEEEWSKSVRAQRELYRPSFRVLWSFDVCRV